ncbi:hypothetical protein N7492_006468 [Penicillium capsulatum]|uniref:Arabinan endo-1,5-alpha-L-arabinosidase n=1 Tax=Penicillium capsulatum TaxID=69766 RepID=A0A9W9I0J2_9EURO|nr:hypothetical protein N7492_006468 [Penicillium capsulatum]KAJ6116308.1 hypothetical protein N7512_006033 [Penicillium capsulatum]
MVRIGFLLASLVALTGAIPAAHKNDKKPPQAFDTTNAYPLPNIAGVITHDPNILYEDGFYYMFKSGLHVPWFKAPSMNGPWESMGSVLSKKSQIPVGARDRPWAPTAIKRNGKFYCFYSVSESGSRESAIGVATVDVLAKSKEDGDSEWTDHGALIRTGKGKYSDVDPFTRTNAIDPTFIEDRDTGKPYLVYGSFWDNIWQIPLSDDLLSIEHPEKPDAVPLAQEPSKSADGAPVEGSWVSYHDGWYYTWFSRGICCEFDNGLPPAGDEYKIRVGRSKNVRGPFQDRQGRNITEGYGEDVYKSNHGVVYAPGGEGVLERSGGLPDILYYHYLNATVGFAFDTAQLGWNYLDYRGGWPVVVPGDDEDFLAGGKKPDSWEDCSTQACM